MKDTSNHPWRRKPMRLSKCATPGCGRSTAGEKECMHCSGGAYTADIKNTRPAAPVRRAQERTRI